MATNDKPASKAFKIPYKTANMLKADLADAGIPYVDDSGRYADFHSLRHSDINLTMSRYTHIFRGQESQAIAKLPDFSLSNKLNQNPLSTGTN